MLTALPCADAAAEHEVEPEAVLPNMCFGTAAMADNVELHTAGNFGVIFQSTSMPLRRYPFKPGRFVFSPLGELRIFLHGRLAGSQSPLFCLKQLCVDFSKGCCTRLYAALALA